MGRNVFERTPWRVTAVLAFVVGFLGGLVPTVLV